MNNWNDDKKWADKFNIEIKRILGECLITEAPIEEDMEHNTDLMVLKLDTIRIACRIRHFNYFIEYPADFTIRCGRPSGIKTELSKIIEGWGDYLFYGFSDEKGISIESWKLISLDSFRLWFNYEVLKTKEVPGILLSNTDGSSDFRVFNTIKMPESIIFKKSE